jgi:hypothetical protein
MSIKKVLNKSLSEASSGQDTPASNIPTTIRRDEASPKDWPRAGCYEGPRSLKICLRDSFLGDEEKMGAGK